MLRILLNHGQEELNHEEMDEEGFPVIYRESVAQFIIADLLNDNLSFEHETHQKILDTYVKSLDNGIVPSSQVFSSNPEPDIALLAVDLLSTPYELHDWKRKNIFVKTELEVLRPLITSTLYSFKEKVIKKRRNKISELLRERNR